MYKNTKTPNGVDFNNPKTYEHLIRNDHEFATWRYGYTNSQGILVNHCGRGYIHTTWKHNYQSYTNYYQKKYPNSKINFVETPDLLEHLPYSLESAFYFWYRNKINLLADQGENKAVIKKITKVVNGGLNGLNDRMEKFNIIINFLKGIK